MKATIPLLVLAFGAASGIAALTAVRPSVTGKAAPPRAAGEEGCGSCGDGKTSATDGSRGGYPLDVCVVSGKRLGSMGDPVVVAVDGTEVYLCCAGCLKEFGKDRAGHLARVRSAAAKDPAGGPR